MQFARTDTVTGTIISENEVGAKEDGSTERTDR